jgi:nucleotide-binding universal stress UspA family protein
VRDRLKHVETPATARGTTFATSTCMSNRTVILTAIDAHPYAEQVVAAAARIAKMPGAELHVVHVVEAPELSRLTKQLEAARAIVEKACASLGDDVVPTVHLAAGEPAMQILQVASNLQADMIVIGTRDLSKLERVLLGSVVEPVTRRAQCPVFVVRPKDYHTREVRGIEPACPDCLETQRASEGEQLWCERHAKRHVHAHLHYELPEGFGGGSALIMPQT